MENRTESIVLVVFLLVVVVCIGLVAFGYPAAATVLLVLIACGYVVTKLIDGLKATGTIKEGEAGRWNQLISFIVAIALFGLKFFGLDSGVPDAERIAVDIAAMIAASGGIAVLARLFHTWVNWMQESQKPPKAIAPAQVEIKAESVSVQK